jgi:hypothetical protein
MGELLINIYQLDVMMVFSAEVSLMILWYVLGCVETLVIIVQERQ